MIETIYVEEAIRNHPRTKFILKKFKKSKISNLIKENLFKVVNVVSYYERLSEEEFKIIAKPKLFNKIKSKWHFSETQSHRLETLLRRIETFCNKRDIEEKIKHCGTSNSVINVLNSKIKNNLVDWSKY